MVPIAKNQTVTNVIWANIKPHFPLPGPQWLCHDDTIALKPLSYVMFTRWATWAFALARGCRFSRKFNSLMPTHNNSKKLWITTHQIETYSTPYMYTLFATSTEHIDRYASTCAHSHTMRARTMRAYASIFECPHSHRIACERISHASCEHSHTLFGRLPCPLCACDASAFASQALASHANARI